MWDWARKWFFLGGLWEISTYGVIQAEDHVPQLVCLPRWARVERCDHLVSKRVVEATFALGVSLHRVDYLIEEDLRLYKLALIDEEDVSPPRIAPGSVVARVPATKIALSGLSAGVVLPVVIPSSSTVVPPEVSSKVALQGVGLRHKRPTASRPCKAPRMGVDDALGRVVASTAAAYGQKVGS